MVLSGTLREFILADVLQLLTQQKINGRLVITTPKTEGTILFKDGEIVGATRGTESFTTRLFYYLTDIADLSRNKVRELFSSYDGKTAALTSYLEKKGFLTHEEMQEYALSMIIDISCSLFLWTSGHYHFDSFTNVDPLIPAGVSLPVENITMEAMRRIDEWHRMKEAITEETIFVQSNKATDFDEGLSPLSDPVQYFYYRNDGTSPFKEFLNNSFLTEYKIYECFYSLLQSEYIVPLSDKLTRTVQAAISRSEQEKSVHTPVLPVLITAGIILLLFFLSWFIRNIIFQDLTHSSLLQKNKLSVSIAEHRSRNSYQFIHMLYVGETDNNENPHTFSLLSRKDLSALTIQQKLQSEILSQTQ